MNNGLIEREKVIFTLRRVFEKYNIGFENGQGGFADEVPKAIKAIPTAYDVDKVVERLEDLEKRANSKADTAKSTGQIETYCVFQQEQTAYMMAVEIVKSGGIEESGEE